MKYFFLILVLLAAEARAQKLSVVTQFDGSAGDGTGTVTRPNSGLASNGTQLFQSNQQTVSYYSTSGNLIASTDFLVWLTRVTPSISCIKRVEPHVYFESFIKRWIFVYSCDTGTWLIVSSGSDLSTATWKAVSTLIPIGDVTMRMGYDVNGIYIDGFDPTCSTQDSLVVFPPSDFQWTGGGTISTAREQLFKCIELRTMPAVDLNPSKALTSPAFFVSMSSPLATGNVAFNLQLRKITWGNTGCSFTPCASLSLPTSIPSGFLANATLNESQPSGNPLRSSESFTVIYTGTVREVGTHLYIARPFGPCLSNCSTQGVDSHMMWAWWDVNPSTLSITQKGKVSSSTTGYLFPTLATDQSGNLVMCASAVSTTRFPSIDCWSRLTTDPLGALSGPTTVTSGTQAYGCNSTNPAPWGNYNDSTQDAVDGTKVWTVVEYGKSNSNCAWQTKLIELTMASSTNPPSSPATSLTHIQ